jgi:Mg2+ and Co2+ transporter CorA
VNVTSRLPIGTVYGMNFGHMAELHWQPGYPLALVLMLSTTSARTSCSGTGLDI